MNWPGPGLGRRGRRLGPRAAWQVHVFFAIGRIGVGFSRNSEKPPQIDDRHLLAPRGAGS
jgi:hypothetical protein